MFGIIGIFFVCAMVLKFCSIDTWNINLCYNEWGHILTFTKMIEENIGFIEPKNYNKEEIEVLIETYENESTDNTEKLPNIVVVMNESFSNLSEVYNIGFTEKSLKNYKNSIFYHKKS